MPTPARQRKRPYVRPRIGTSVSRSLWYAAAFLALLVIAVLMPRTSAPPLSLEGDWLFVTPSAVGTVPAGQTTLWLHGGHYTLRTQADDGAVRVEFGSVDEAADRPMLEPFEVLTVRPDGTGTREETTPHVFSLEFQDGKLALISEAGQRMEGERRPFVPASSDTAAAPR